MTDKHEVSIKYFTDPLNRELEPAKAVQVLYDLVEKLDGDIQDLRARIKHLEDMRKP